MHNLELTVTVVQRTMFVGLASWKLLVCMDSTLGSVQAISFFFPFLGTCNEIHAGVMDSMWTVQALRRLAQNREAARKSRLRKKASRFVKSSSPSDTYFKQFFLQCIKLLIVIMIFHLVLNSGSQGRVIVNFGVGRWFCCRDWQIWLVVVVVNQSGVCTATGIQPRQVESTGAGTSECSSTRACEFHNQHHDNLVLWRWSAELITRCCTWWSCVASPLLH